MSDWSTVADLATGAGTLVLAFATFASVRSANRAARAAEQSMLAGLRPLLLPSRQQDPPQKVGFQDDHWVSVDGAHATAEVMIDVLYGDFDGGQRMITRFLLIPGSDERWLAAASHHWNLDRAEPR